LQNCGTLLDEHAIGVELGVHDAQAPLMHAGVPPEHAPELAFCHLPLLSQ